MSPSITRALVLWVLSGMTRVWAMESAWLVGLGSARRGGAATRPGEYVPTQVAHQAQRAHGVHLEGADQALPVQRAPHVYGRLAHRHQVAAQAADAERRFVPGRQHFVDAHAAVAVEQDLGPQQVVLRAAAVLVETERQLATQHDRRR